MITTGLCRDGHVETNQPADVVLADLATGWTAVTFCKTCGQRVETSITEATAVALFKAGAHRVGLKGQTDLRQSIARRTNEGPMDKWVDVWAESLPAVRSPIVWLEWITGVAA